MNINPFSEWLRHLRQLCYPRAFRIASDAVDASEFNALLVHIEAATQQLNLAADSSSTDAPDAADDERFMADLATRLWRIQTKMIDPTTSEPFESVTRSFQHLERLIGELEAKGIRAEDKTGEIYDPGMMVTVLSHEPVTGIAREIIHETVEPAVYHNERLIQRAQIVVGTPANNAGGST